MSTDDKYKLVLVPRESFGNTMVKSLLDAGVIIVGPNDGGLLLCAPVENPAVDMDAFIRGFGIGPSWVGTTEISRQDLPWYESHGALLADTLRGAVNDPLVDEISVSWPRGPRGRFTLRLVAT